MISEQIASFCKNNSFLVFLKYLSLRSGQCSLSLTWLVSIGSRSISPGLKAELV